MVFQNLELCCLSLHRRYLRVPRILSSKNDYLNVACSVTKINRKKQDMLLPRKHRNCRKQNHSTISPNVVSVCSKRRKSLTSKKSIRHRHKSEKILKESSFGNKISNKMTQNVLVTHTPFVSPIEKNSLCLPDQTFKRHKNSSSKKKRKTETNRTLQPKQQAVKEEDTLLRKLSRSCKRPASQFTKANKPLHSKQGRKPLMCKRNIMHQDRSDSKMKEFSFQNADLDESEQLVHVTSTPIAPNQMKVKKIKDINTPIQNSIRKKDEGSKKKVKSNQTVSFEASNVTTRSSSRYSMLKVSLRSKSLKETPHNSKACAVRKNKGIRKSNQKQFIRQRNVKGKTFAGEIPIDDLSLTKFVPRKRKAKSDGVTVPSKQTLKRKRYVINELKRANDGYEDDMYESQKFDCFKELLQDTSDSDIPSSISTPKFGFPVTPMIPIKTPIFKDCISPSEYAINRKIAEECMHRKKKRKSACKETPVVPEKKKLEFNQVLESIERQEKMIEKVIEHETSDIEDSYFSDC